MATYAPWSYSALLQRLKTYTLSTWTEIDIEDEFYKKVTSTESKGSSGLNTPWLTLTPVDCAAHGWVAFSSTSNNQENVAGGILRCVTCSKIKSVIVPVPDMGCIYEPKTCDNKHEEKYGDDVNWTGYTDEFKNQLLVTKTMIDHVRRELRDEHSVTCPWRRMPDSQKFTNGGPYYKRLEGNTPSVTIMSEYNARKRKLEELILPQEIGTDISTIEVYASMGWTPLTDSPQNSGTHILECDACFRKIVVKSQELQSQAKIISGKINNEIDNDTKLPEKWKADLAHEHKSYCAYLHVSQQKSADDKGSKRIPAYEKILKTAIMIRNASSRVSSAHNSRKSSMGEHNSMSRSTTPVPLSSLNRLKIPGTVESNKPVGLNTKVENNTSDMMNLGTKKVPFGISNSLIENSFSYSNAEQIAKTFRDTEKTEEAIEYVENDDSDGSDEASDAYEILKEAQQRGERLAKIREIYRKI